MTLYELANATSLQGNIEIKVLNGAYSEKESRCFRSQDDFNCTYTDNEDVEDCEVIFMYASKSEDGTEWMVIEVKEED